MADEPVGKACISSQLLLAFVGLGLLMVLGGAIALQQLDVMRKRAERLYQADQPARAVLRVRSDFLSHQRDLQQLSLTRDATRFATEAEKVRSAFRADTDLASRALLALPPGSERDSELRSLETVQALFAGQVQSLIALAGAGDWAGVRLRFENRMPVINDLSESLVHDIDAIVEIERQNRVGEMRRARSQAIGTLVVTGLLTLATAALLGLRVTRSIGGRLERLDVAAHALARGDFAHQVVVSGEDEIARLSLAFNEMAARLRSLYEALRRREAHFRSLIEHAMDFILVVDAKGSILYASPSMEREFARKGTLAGEELVALADPADVDAVRSLLEPPAAGERPGTKEVRLRAADGSLRVLEAYGQDLLQDPAIGGIVLNARDVTGRRRMEEQLRQAQRMEAIGTLSGGIAHDFNNLLTVIRGYSSQLVESLRDLPRARRQAKGIDDAAQRAASLTRQLLAFGRRQVLQPRVLDLNALLGALEPMLRRMIGEDVATHAILDPGLGRVRADPGQIEQVIMNLVVNARDAMPRGGTLTLQTTNVELDEAHAAAHPGSRPGPHVVLSVTDTGEGMDPETLTRIFEPFFTTKGIDKGTGLGLSSVYGIVQQSGGHVGVYSEPARGSTFKVYLPRVSEDVEPAGEREPPRADPRGGETVLLIEDEPPIRELVLEYLTECGYSVLTVDDPLRAAPLSEQHPGPIHLLLTDVVLPGLSGTEVAGQITARRRETKVLYMSGYAAGAIARHGVLAAGTNFLEKPFTLADLASKVRDVLDGRR